MRDALSATGALAMFIGGVAVIARGVARFTADIDATIEIPSSDLEKVARVFARHHLRPRIANALAFARTNGVLLLRHEPTDVDVDITFASLPFEHEALIEATEVPYGRIRLRAARAEDLVVYKLVAHRPQDLEDAEKLVLLHADTIDTRRITAVVGQLAAALDDEARVATAARILKTVRRSSARPPSGRRSAPRRRGRRSSAR